MSDEMPIGPAWVPVFLETLAVSGVVKQAMQAAGVRESVLYAQRDTNRRFDEAWQAALAASPRAEAAKRDGRRTRLGGWRGVFLAALAESSNVTAASVRANVPLRTVYNVRRADAAFAAGWRTALHEGYDRLEMELLGHLRDPRPERTMDVAAATRLLAAHRATVARQRALNDDEDEPAPGLPRQEPSARIL
jgi:hypothetical protein